MSSFNLNLSGFPIKKEVSEEIQDERNFTVCEPKESVLESGLIKKKKKYLYVHLKENNGDREWSVLIISPDEEPRHFKFPS